MHHIFKDGNEPSYFLTSQTPAVAESLPEQTSGKLRMWKQKKNRVHVYYGSWKN